MKFLLYFGRKRNEKKKNISLLVLFSIFLLVVPVTAIAQKQTLESDENMAELYQVNYSAENGTITANIKNDEKVPEGTEVTFTAQANEGYTFDYWAVKNENDELISKSTEMPFMIIVNENIKVEAVIFEGNAENPTVDYVRKEVENFKDNYIWSYGKTVDQAYAEINVKIDELKEKLKLDSKEIFVTTVKHNNNGYVEVHIVSAIEGKNERVRIYSSECLKAIEAINAINALKLTWDTDMSTTIKNYENNEELQNIVKKYKDEGLDIILVHDELTIYYVVKNDSKYVKTGRYITNAVGGPEYELFKKTLQEEMMAKDLIWTPDLTVDELKKKIRNETKDIILNANKQLREMNSKYRFQLDFRVNYYNNTQIVETLYAGVKIENSAVQRAQYIPIANPKLNELIVEGKNAD